MATLCWEQKPALSKPGEKTSDAAHAGISQSDPLPLTLPQLRLVHLYSRAKHAFPDADPIWNLAFFLSSIIEKSLENQLKAGMSYRFFSYQRGDAAQPICYLRHLSFELTIIIGWPIMRRGKACFALTKVSFFSPDPEDCFWKSNPEKSRKNSRKRYDSKREASSGKVSKNRRKTDKEKRSSKIIDNLYKNLKTSDSARIQTWNLLIRSQILYSVELRSRLKINV